MKKEKLIADNIRNSSQSVFTIWQTDLQAGTGRGTVYKQKNIINTNQKNK
jgi:hypothetical protein